MPPGQTWWDDDPKATGFGVRSYPGGGKSFFVDYRIDGRQRRITIGPFPRWSADAARERAKELRKLIDRGHDPAGSKRERREAPTVQDLIERYIEDHLPTEVPHRPRASRTRSACSRRSASISASTPRSSMSTAATSEKCTARSANRLGVAGKSRAGTREPHPHGLLEDVLALAGAEGRGDTALAQCGLGNPCKGIERNHEEGRERFFSQKELAAISDALAEYQGVAADCVRLIMLTGCRPSEAMQATWAEFDNEPGYWIKPSAHVKQRKTHKLPLSPAAIELVERLRKKRARATGFSPATNRASTWPPSGMFGTSSE